jgi:RNA polymerase sigma-70 factor (ECF subfamily)
LDEQHAIQRLKAGDIRGLAALVKRYQSEAIETAYLITHDLALAEDVAQDVFLQVYRYSGSFDASRPFRPWFMRSVVHAAVKAAQQEGQTMALDTPIAGDEITLIDLLPDPAPGPEVLLEQAELEQVLEAALRRLSPDQRAAVVLRYYLDLDDETISDQLNCATSTVRWRLHTARKQLRQWLNHLSPVQLW